MVPVAQAAKVEAKLSGQVNRAITFADNGVNSDALFVDNNASGTRMRFTGNTEMGNGMKAGIHWESQYQDNSSSQIDINDGDNASQFISRFREVWFSGGWGKLYLGQGNGAANGSLESDLSGLFIISNADTNLGDGVTFRINDGTEDGTSVRGSGLGGFDGLSRNDRLRYDTPALGPLVLSGDVGQEKFELAARLSSKFGGGGKVVAALAYVDTKDEGVGAFNGSQLSTSASVLLPGGFNLTGAYGQRDLDDRPGDDPKYWYLKAGWITGVHHFGISYRARDDTAAIGEETREGGLQYLANLKDYGVELYAGVFQREAKESAAEKITMFHVGSRIKF
jgi:predicted porin